MIYESYYGYSRLICIYLFLPKIGWIRIMSQKLAFSTYFITIPHNHIVQNQFQQLNHNQSRRAGHYLVHLYGMCLGLKHHSQRIRQHTILYSHKSHSVSFKIPLKTPIFSINYHIKSKMLRRVASYPYSDVGHISMIAIVI